MDLGLAASANSSELAAQTAKSSEACQVSLGQRLGLVGQDIASLTFEAENSLESLRACLGSGEPSGDLEQKPSADGLADFSVQDHTWAARSALNTVGLDQLRQDQCRSFVWPESCQVSYRYNGGPEGFCRVGEETVG